MINELSLLFYHIEYFYKFMCHVYNIPKNNSINNEFYYYKFNSNLIRSNLLIKLNIICKYYWF
jgi:G:T-mismatch repair DNA endonuclease (very short patch repair protein)